MITVRHVLLLLLCVLLSGACAYIWHEDRYDVGPQWSPGGQHVLFRIADLDDDNLGATGMHVCVLDLEGKSDRIWLEDAVTSERLDTAQWSPDGQRLAFSSGPGVAEDVNIFVLDTGTRKVSRLTKLEGGSLEPEWSPDGRHLAFIWYDEADLLQRVQDYSAGVTAVYVVNADGSDARELVRVPGGTLLDFSTQRPWSPDGEKLVFSVRGNSDRKLYVTDVDTRQIVALTDSLGYEYAYQWSPDSKRIAFTLISSKEGHKAVYLVDADGHNLSHVMDIGDRDYDPVYWSPDGTRLALLLKDMARPSVFIATADGSRVTKQVVLNSVVPGRDALVWSPDGKRIAVIQSEGAPLYIANLATDDFLYVPPPTGFHWDPFRNWLDDFEGFWNWSPDGQWIVTRAETQNETGIFLVDPENGEIVPVITLPNLIGEPVWMSGGERLAFIAYHPDGRDVAQPVAYVVGLDGEVVRQVPVDCEWPID